MSLRNCVLAVALVALAGSLVALPFQPAVWPGLFWSALLLIGVLGERVHYRGNAGAGGVGHWQDSGERFMDPETGRPVIVEYNPATGERRYREHS